MTLRDEIVTLAEEAKAASGKLATTTADERNGALAAMAAALREHAAEIVMANSADMDAPARRVRARPCSTGSCWTSPA